MINLGNKQRIRPNQLVNYLHDELKIHREHFGKILIQEDKTYIEINAQALKYLKPLNQKKYLGLKLYYQIVRSIPKKIK